MGLRKFFLYICVFTIFAVITYKTSINCLWLKKKITWSVRCRQVASRLANSDQELTLVRTYRNLTKNDSGVIRASTTELQQLMELNEDRLVYFRVRSVSFELIVYNLNHGIDFKTHENNLSLIDVQRKPPTIVTLDRYTGFFVDPANLLKRNERKNCYAQTFYELTSFYEIRSKLSC